MVSSPDRARHSTRRFVRLAHLNKLRECEQVAAVCYRVRKEEVEFLLVRTRGSGRWTFPKGSAEPGLTHAQAAALEAFEEAGVHGRIEEAPFTRYVCRKRGGTRKAATKAAAEKMFEVTAHLCQVLRLGKPKESNRDRTWFSVKDARRSLRDGRDGDDGAELARVVDKAVARIQRSRGRAAVNARPSEDRQNQDRRNDGLQKIQFEAVAESPNFRGRLGQAWRSTMAAENSQGRKLLQGDLLPFFSTPEIDRNSKWFPGKKMKALGTGTNSR
jgi:8-oxo-dGTP pyrophosphatase MutT (NUDIX family)